MKKLLAASREFSTVAILRRRGAVLHLVSVAGGRAARTRSSTPSNALLILKYSSIYGIAAVGAAIVIISGGIDLAPGAVIALAGVVTGDLFVEAGWPLGAGAWARACSWASRRGCSAPRSIVLVRLPPFIATLGVMGITRGAAFIITEGRYFDVSSKLLGGWRPLGLPADWLAPLVMIALAVVFQVLMTRFQWGRACSRSAATRRRRSSPASPSAGSRRRSTC